MVKGQNLRVYAVALAIFVLGGVAGGAVAHALSERDERELAAGGFEGFEQRKLRALTRKLDLSDEQRERVRVILREDRGARRKMTEEAFARCGKPLEQHRSETDARIRELLNPEQKQRFEEIARRRRDPFHGPPPPRGP
jgi:Spy/CpxP family protein refolding chaperone